ncbi:CPBP family intramembrane glutamic endopeptidase [Clostridium frigidicarnis]|uniref:CPBP family intramembrane glutamic endopeptidase n=1 Tax=Clostridium frigidicarnis TaxID=84698 RepID=UPI0015A70679|nr:CPBP family intramembrane glutamic endopeptidase [Clostridium frigidicarnis]
MIRNIVFYGGLKLVLEFVVTFIFAMILAFIHPYAPDEYILDTINKNGYCIIFGIDLLVMLVFILILSNREENLWIRSNFKKMNFKCIWKNTLVAIGLFVVSMSIMNLVGYIDVLSDSIEELGKPINCPMGILSMVILIPIFEETLFRGLIFRELRNNINIIVGLIIQALIFSAFYDIFMQMRYSFVIGLILGIIYYWNGSIWASIIPHAVYNGCVILMFKIGYMKAGKLNLLYLVFGMIIFIIGMTLLYNDFKNSNSMEFNISV